jgi:uncharacterized protein YijF (DUF1287 family)
LEFAPVKKPRKRKSRAQADQRAGLAAQRALRPAAQIIVLSERRPVETAQAWRLPVGLSWQTQNSVPRTSPVAISSIERQTLQMFMLPLLLAAVVLALMHAVSSPELQLDAGDKSPASVFEPSTISPGQLALAPLRLPIEAPAVAGPVPLTGPLTAPITKPAKRNPQRRVATASAQRKGSIALNPLSMPIEPPQIVIGLIAPAPEAPDAPKVTNPALPEPTVAIAIPPVPADTDKLQEAALEPPQVCTPPPKRVAMTTPPPPAEFGAKLAATALEQTNHFVIYSATYKRISYPLGDIPSLYGSCSDVVIRAYRALGLDLQELVQRAGAGSGDTNIDHRRTETLRLFFARHGDVIPPSNFAEDYKAGDIVTYYRPFSRVSRAHIAIVADVIGPSGRPMIVHNRGWGPQLEDALFVDRITGHYRFNDASSLMAGRRRIENPGVASAPRPLSGALVKPVSITLGRRAETTPNR